MATSLLDADDGQDDATKEDASSSFVRHMAAKYEKEDSAALASEDDDDETESTDDDDSDDEHTDADTSADDPDGDADESTDDSTDDDDTDHTDDDESEESDDDDTADDDEEEEEEEEDDDDVSDETKAHLAKAGADLKLEDIPKEYRSIVTQKLRSIDSAFTRQSKEATAFRAERTKVQAEEAFRTEHPDLYIAEFLQKHPDLIEKVQARIDKNEDPDNAEVFGMLLKGKRQEALAAAQEKERAEEEKVTQAERSEERANHLYTKAMKLAADAGLPARAADLAIGSALLQLPADKRDLTDAQVAQIITAEAKVWNKEHRTTKRAKSKEQIQSRTAAKKAAPPATRRAGVTPRPGKQKGPVVDMNNEESRQAAMLRSMKKIMPGTK